MNAVTMAIHPWTCALHKVMGGAGTELYIEPPRVVTSCLLDVYPSQVVVEGCCHGELEGKDLKGHWSESNEIGGWQLECNCSDLVSIPFSSH